MTGHVTLAQFGYTSSFQEVTLLEIEVTGRPWEPYKRQAIKVTGTIKSVKTDASRAYGRREIRKGANHLDTVRGFPGGAANQGRGCFGDCYANEARMLFMNKILRVTDYPSELNRLLQIVDLYKVQLGRPELSKDLQFATKLISCLLSRLDLSINPRVVFSEGFFSYSADNVCIFAIPYSFMQSYEKWVILAHEVGHLFIQKKCSIDYEKLTMTIGEVLLKNGNEMVRQINDKLFRLILSIKNWAYELVCDSIGIFLSGAAYMSEIIFYSTRNIFEEGSVSHPTISFRLAVQIALLERIGIDVSNVEQFRTKSTKQPSDDLTKTLLSLDIVPHIVDWIMEHECITNLISNWDSIFTTANQISEGKQPSAGLDMIFSALAYLAFDRSTAQEFELLREESLK